MLSITLEESFIIFDNKYSSQDAEVDSRWLWFLGKLISNIFWEKYSNQNITKNFWIFLCTYCNTWVFTTAYCLYEKQHANITFSIESEKNGVPPF